MSIRGRWKVSVSLAVLLTIIIPILCFQNAFAQLDVGITNVTVPPKVAVGQSFTIAVSVVWSELGTLKKEYGPPYLIAVNVCEGPGTPDNYKSCKDLAWAPSKSGETVEPSGSKTYSIQLTAPEQARVWQLAVWLSIMKGQATTTPQWTLLTGLPNSREFNVNVVDTFTLTVEIQPASPNIAISLDGSSGNTDASGRAQFQLSTTDSHAVQLPSEVPAGTGMKIVFVKWSDGQTANSRTVNLTEDTILTAEYKTLYLLTVESPTGNPQGSGWYDKGASATFSVESPQPEEGFFGSLGGKVVLQAWTGDSTADTATASISMDAPKAVEAQWTTDNSQPYMILGGIGAAIVIAIILVFVLIRRRGAAPPPPPVIPTRPAVPPRQAAATQPRFCVNCGSPMTYIGEHQRYYCYNCQQYA